MSNLYETLDEGTVKKDLLVWYLEEKIRESQPRRVLEYAKREEDCRREWENFEQKLRWLKMDLLTPQEHLKACAEAWKNLRKGINWHRSFDAVRAMVRNS